MNDRFKRPDKKSAQSLIAAAERDIQYTYSIPITPQSSSTVVKNVYDCFRQIADALLIARGKAPHGHMKPFEELLALQVKTTRPINLVESLRIARNNVSYYGYHPTVSEAEDAISIARACFEPLKKRILEEVKD